MFLHVAQNLFTIGDTIRFRPIFRRLALGSFRRRSLGSFLGRLLLDMESWRRKTCENEPKCDDNKPIKHSI